MSALQQPTTTGQLKMSALRKCLKRPHAYLALLASICLAAAIDSYRPASSQWTASTYVNLVRIYQKYGRPLTSKCIQCRYRPTCSEYSLQAVQTHGIRRGLSLTYRRLPRCPPAVPLGTEDRIPENPGRRRGTPGKPGRGSHGGHGDRWDERASSR